MKIHPVPIIIGTAAGLGAGLLIGASALSTTTLKTVAGPTVTKTVKVPSGIKTVKVKVPGPVQYKTDYVPATQGPTGTVVAKYSGSGNEVTGSFTVPSTGDYIVSWNYSGNYDTSLGDDSATNFSITPNNNSGEAGSEPNDIAASGSGSTEDTGMSGTQSFNVQAAGSWSVTVTSAS